MTRLSLRNVTLGDATPETIAAVQRVVDSTYVPNDADIARSRERERIAQQQPLPAPIFPRSTTVATVRYEVQTQSPAGNWVMSIGTDDLANAQASAIYQRDTLRHIVRIIDNDR